MITAKEFWRIMDFYSSSIYPSQLIFYIAGLLIVAWLFIRPGNLINLMVKIYMAVSFTWIGLFFNIWYARGMAGKSNGNYFFGAIFFLVSLMFLKDIFRQKMNFILPVDGWRRPVVLFFTVLVFCYPFFGLLFSYRNTILIMPGTFPCPTAALGLLLLSTSLPQVDIIIYILLLFCAVPFTPFFQIARYGVFEDIILFICGIYSLIILVRNWKSVKAQTGVV